MTTHREAFIKTQNYFSITGTALHKVTGVSQNHISEFINSKRDVRTTLLDRLVQGMEELKPGAKEFYLSELGGEKAKVTVADPTALVDAMDNKQMSELMFAIAAKMGSKKDRQLKTEKLAASC